MTTEKGVEKGISNIVGVFTDPIIVFPGGWGEDIPDWLKNAITLQRLVMNVRALKGEEMTGTDAEACAYLMTTSLAQPLDHDWTKIYLYIAGKTFTHWGKSEMPDDIRVESLNDYQMRKLNELKAWIYHKRTTARQDKDRADRREARKEETSKKKGLQPSFF